MNTETNKIIEQAKKDGWVIICGEPSVNDYWLSAWDSKGRLRLQQRIKNHNDAYSTELIDILLKDKASENNMEEEIPEKDNTEVKLHNTTDAQIWTDEFIKTLRKVFPEIFDDPNHIISKQRYEDFEEWVFGWFCNAIQTGIDLTHNERDKKYIYILQTITGGIVKVYDFEPSEHDMNSSYGYYLGSETTADASKNCILYRYNKYTDLQYWNGKVDPDTKYNWKNL